MRFLVDECVGPAVTQWLRGIGYDIVSIFDEYRGADDEDILRLADEENRILITCDKDFGEAVFHGKKYHKGVILLRLDNERSANKIAVLERLFDQYSTQLPNRFVVATESAVRIAEIGHRAK